MPQTKITTKVLEALEFSGCFISSASMARGLNVPKWQVIEAFDEIEAAGIRLHRQRGMNGGASLVEGPRRRAKAA